MRNLTLYLLIALDLGPSAGDTHTLNSLSSYCLALSSGSITSGQGARGSEGGGTEAVVGSSELPRHHDVPTRSEHHSRIS